MSSDAERDAAAARALRVRVVENEPLAQETGVVVEDGAVDEGQALGINGNLRTVGALVDEVGVLAGDFPSEDVFEAGTAAGLDPYTKAGLPLSPLVNHSPDMGGRVGGDFNHYLRLFRSYFSPRGVG